MSGIDEFPEYNNWAGNLPLKVYIKNGFEILDTIDGNKNVPDHLQSEARKYNPNNFKQSVVIRRINRM